MYPMTVASTVAHIVMKVQQDLADLVIKGDTALENIFPPKDEQPEWATFDEDLSGDADGPVLDGERLTEGRFALYTVADGVETKAQGTDRRQRRRRPPAHRRSPRNSTTSR